MLQHKTVAGRGSYRLTLRGLQIMMWLVDALVEKKGKLPVCSMHQNRTTSKSSDQIMRTPTVGDICSRQKNITHRMTKAAVCESCDYHFAVWLMMMTAIAARAELGYALRVQCCWCLPNENISCWILSQVRRNCAFNLQEKRQMLFTYNDKTEHLLKIILKSL